MSFGAPPSVAREWLISNSLLTAVSLKEMQWLQGSAALDAQTQDKLRWNIESLWAAVWAGGLVQDLTPVQPVADTLASLLPSLRNSEATHGFLSRDRLRPLEELYPKLDLFYRAHWYARDCELAGRDAAPFNVGIVQCRRQLLEWVTHADVEWEDVELST